MQYHLLPVSRASQCGLFFQLSHLPIFASLFGFCWGCCFSAFAFSQFLRECAVNVPNMLAWLGEALFVFLTVCLFDCFLFLCFCVFSMCPECTQYVGLIRWSFARGTPLIRRLISRLGHQSWLLFPILLSRICFSVLSIFVCLFVCLTFIIGTHLKSWQATPISHLIIFDLSLSPNLNIAIFYSLLCLSPAHFSIGTDMIWKICCGVYFRHFCKSSSEIPALSIWLHTYTHVNANSGKVHCLTIAILYGNILSLHMCKATPTCKQTDVAKVAITRLLLASSCCSVVFYKLWNRLHDRSSPFERSRRVSDCDCEWWSTMKCLSTTSSKCVKGTISTNRVMLNSFDPTITFFRYVNYFHQSQRWSYLSHAMPSPSLHIRRCERVYTVYGKYSILGLEKSDFPVTVKYLGRDVSGNAATCPRPNSTRFASPAFQSHIFPWAEYRSMFLPSLIFQ